MKILSWNVNGLRAAQRKGFSDWLDKSQPEILCLQEIKAQPDQLPFDLLKPTNYHTFFHSAIKKGYAGVAVYTRKKPLAIKRKLGLKRFDQEGLLLQLEYKNLLLVNLYLPHGGRGKEKLDYKLEVYHHLFNYLKKLKRKNILLIGDFNIAHQEVDLARPKQNKNNIMFTPEERKQIDKLINLGFEDTFRKFHSGNGHYTWWPYAFNARERNMGWRIDYTFISKPLTPKIKDAFILPKIKGSDHCPIGVEMAH